MNKNKVFRALKSAFPHTIPIFAGFWFLALAYGINMATLGFSFVYPMCMAAFIYGGSLEFIAMTMLLSPFAPVQSFLMAFMIQARHLFYGISMLEKYKGLGWKKFYLIFAMCDETFSINYTAKIPDDVDKGWFYFWTSFLNQIYWVSGATIGGLVGSLIKFNTEGLSFCMTAMFIVILMEQWFKEKKHYTAFIGFFASFVCLLIFGADKFLIPSMILILAMLFIFKKPFEKHEIFSEETTELKEEEK